MLSCVDPGIMALWSSCKTLFSSLLVKFSVSVLIVFRKCDSNAAFMILLTSYTIYDKKIFSQQYPVICAEALGISCQEELLAELASAYSSDDFPFSS